MRRSQGTSERRGLFILLVIATFLITPSTFIHRDAAPRQSPDLEGGGARAGGRSGAMEALEFWAASRVYPTGEIPRGAVTRAWQARRHIPTASRASRAVTPGDPRTPGWRNSGSLPDDNWRSIGPTNVAGRMLCIAVDPANPSILYAGSASGGLWRSQSAGLGGDWQRVGTGFPVLGVSAIALDPTTPGVIYIGTGEVYRYQWATGGVVQRTTRGSYGLGILKSTDGGATWTRSMDWSENEERGVQAIRLNPRNSRTVFAATTEGVYRSPDAGATWELTLPVLMARDLAIDVVDTSLVLVTAGDFASSGAGVYRSTNGGYDFAFIDSLPSFSGYARLEASEAYPGLCYLDLADSTLSTGGLWKTSDFGASWSEISGASLYGVQGWYSHFVAVHPADSTRLVLGAVSIYKSADGGLTFLDVGGTWFDHHDHAHDPANPDILYVVNDGGVWRSTDFGDHWQWVSAGLVTSQFYNGFSNSRQDSALALGQVQDHYGFQYGGSPEWASGGRDEVGWTAISPATDSVMYAVTRLGRLVWKSVDRGLTWSYLPVGGGLGLACWNTPLVLARSNPDVIYFGREIVAKSTDGGATWAPTNDGAALDGNPPLCMAISATSPDTVYVGTAPYGSRARIFLTGNGGGTWNDVTHGLPNRYPLDIAVDTWNSSRAFVVFGGFGGGHVYLTTTAGASWIDVTGTLPDAPATAVMIDPSNLNDVYVGTDAGVFLSRNGGGTWGTFEEGLPEAVNVADITMSVSNRMVRLVTHGNGVWERRAVGQPWTSVVGGDGSLDPRGAATGAESRAGIMLRVSPNPARAAAHVEFEIRRAARLHVAVHDVRGRGVAVLADREVPAGRGAIPFDVAGLAPGVYICTVRIGTATGDDILRSRFVIER